MKHSVISVASSHFRNCEGNAVNFGFSDGVVTNSEFREFVSPAMVVFDPAATRMITDCVSDRCKGMGVVARDGCVPTFSRVKWDRIALNELSMSDYAL
jgi:hypothetical protein